MRLLLDTQAFLYFIMGNPALSGRARALIENPDNDRFLSLASVWEIAIKTSIGKLTFTQPLAELLLNQLDVNAITLQPVTFDHVMTVATLPLHHRDPFDRMLIAQSMVEGIPLISGDEILDRYPVQRLW